LALTIILALSILVQLTAAFFALRLIRVTGVRTAWVLIAAAFCFMALRRLISHYWLISGRMTHPEELVNETVALVTSLLLLAGVIFIAPLFQTIKQAAATLQRSKEELEGLSRRAPPN